MYKVSLENRFAYRWWQTCILNVNDLGNIFVFLVFLSHKYFMFKINLQNCFCLQIVTDTYFRCFIVNFLRIKSTNVFCCNIIFLFTWVLSVQSQFTKRLLLLDGERHKFYMFYDVFPLLQVTKYLFTVRFDDFVYMSTLCLKSIYKKSAAGIII